MNPVNGDAFRGLCDHTFWHNAAPRENPGFRHGDVVFCKIDEVWRLFRALRRTRKRIVLVTGEGDKPVTPDLWQQRPPHVAAWFGTNMFAAAETAHPLPLGLGNADGTLTLAWTEIQAALVSPPKREGLLYANFGTRSNPAVRGPLLEWVLRPEQNWITRQPHSATGGKAAYLRDLLTHHFVLCPPGNGEDTHRMWEALYCGAVPVVRRSPAMRDFHDLPVLFVEDFLTLAPERLAASAIRGSREKMDLAWWKSRLQAACSSARQKGTLSSVEWLQGWLQEIQRICFRHALTADDAD